MKKESDSGRREEKWQTSAEKLEHAWPAEKERAASEKAVGKNVEAAFAPPKKEQSRLSKAPDHEGERVKVGESRTLARERGIRARAWRGKGGLHSEGRQIPKRKGRACKKSIPKRSRRKHEQVSERKSSPGRSAESWFHSKSGQT